MTNGPQPPLARALAAWLERALNREIAESSAALDLLAELDGESLGVDVRGLGLHCVLRASRERIAVERSSVASATLTASPFDLLRLARASDLATLRGTGATITGSPEVAERFAKLLKLARPDLEEHAARWIGDVRTHLLRPIAWMRRILPRRKSGQPLGARLRLALEELGPIFVKFGQMLSVRPDLLDPEVARELAKLQDQVPPFPGELAVATLESAFGRKVEDLFAEFERTPLAAASIAQVHAARLSDGKAVVVKVLRPNVAKLIARDVEVLYAIAGLAEAYWPEARRLHPREIVVEFEKTLGNELDLMREAANAAQLERNFAGSELLHVPEVHWDYCRPNVLTLEQIFGVQIDDL